MNEYIVNEIIHIVKEICEIKYAKKHNILRSILWYVKRKKKEIEESDKIIKTKLSKVGSRRPHGPKF